MLNFASAFENSVRSKRIHEKPNISFARKYQTDLLVRPVAIAFVANLCFASIFFPSRNLGLISDIRRIWLRISQEPIEILKIENRGNRHRSLLGSAKNWWILV